MIPLTIQLHADQVRRIVRDAILAGFERDNPELPWSAADINQAFTYMVYMIWSVEVPKQELFLEIDG